MLDSLLKRLAEADLFVRADAINAPKALADPRKLDGLAALARDPRADELGRRDAIRLIEEEPGAAATEHLAAIALDGAAPPDTRARAVSALSRREPGRFDAVADALAADPNADVRAAAVGYAERLSAARAATLARAALRDASSGVRSAAHFPIERHRLAPLAPLLVEALLALEARLRAEKPDFGFWDRRYEEDALIRALAACTAAPGFAGIVAPIRDRLLDFASDPDNDDVEQQIFLYRNAREILAAAGIKT